MIRNIKLLFMLAFLCICSRNTFAQPLKEGYFKDEEKIAFVGNSIAMDGGFYHDIFLYYLTRYPGEKIRLYNCGIGGDVAAGIIHRLQPDVLSHHPDYAVLMVGMNDVNRDYYSATSDSQPGIALERRKTLETYFRNLDSLVRLILKSGCKLILQTPSIFDQTEVGLPENFPGVNDALELCARYTKELGVKYHCLVVDYWTILHDVNARMQKEDPSSTIIGKDRVHPGAPGHLLMAYCFLKTTGAPALVSKTTIDWETRKNQCANCKIDRLSGTRDSLQFDLLESSLPFPTEEGAKMIDRYVPLYDSLNSELLVLKGLPVGKYSLFIDTVPIASFTNMGLSTGVNLARFVHTPQYVQALAVMEACKKYWQIEAEYRSIKLIDYGFLADVNTDGIPTDSLIDIIHKKLDEIKGKSYYDYLKAKCANYLANRSKVAEFIKQMDTALEAIRQLNHPTPHTYSIVRQVDSGVSARHVFQATWESLKKQQVPDWFRDAKFGIFIHWGVYSVPGFGSEWYPRRMYLEGTPEYKRHIEKYGEQKKFGYKDFIPAFKAEKFDPDQWALLFKEAGAKYVVPVAEHHDGFAMYNSALSDWTAVKMGPHRDIIGELSEAIRKQGMIFGLSSHRIEHWWFFNGGRKFESDVMDPAYTDFYGPAREENETMSPEFMNDWLLRCTELVDKYKPQLFWFDWWLEQPALEPYRKSFAAYYYNKGAEWKKGVVINYKFNVAFPENAAVLDLERGKLDGIRALPWQTDDAIGDSSWGYIEHNKFKTAQYVITNLIDIVSKNGNLLLNIGPRPDGTITAEETQVLLGIGKWLSINGEAIYGTRPWVMYGEGPTKSASGSFADQKTPFTAADIRFTRKNDTLYALVLGVPKDKIAIMALSKRAGHGVIEQITLLGSDEKISWLQKPDSLVIRASPHYPSENAVAYRIIFRGR
jgi:alpha-L-fucosidase